MSNSEQHVSKRPPTSKESNRPPPLVTKNIHTSQHLQPQPSRQLFYGTTPTTSTASLFQQQGMASDAATPCGLEDGSRNWRFSATPAFGDLPVTAQIRQVFVEWTEGVLPANLTKKIRPPQLRRQSSSSSRPSSRRGTQGSATLILPGGASFYGGGASRRANGQSVSPSVRRRSSSAAPLTWGDHVVNGLSACLIFLWKAIVFLLRGLAIILVTMVDSVVGTFYFLAVYWSGSEAKEKNSTNSHSHGGHDPFHHLRDPATLRKQSKGQQTGVAWWTGVKNALSFGGGAEAKEKDSGKGKKKRNGGNKSSKNKKGGKHGGKNAASKSPQGPKHAAKSGDIEAPTSERRRRYVVSITGSPSTALHRRSESSTSTDSSSTYSNSSTTSFDEEEIIDEAEYFAKKRHGSMGYYYDIEEGSFQPTARLLFGSNYYLLKSEKEKEQGGGMLSATAISSLVADYLTPTAVSSNNPTPPAGGGGGKHKRTVSFSLGGGSDSADPLATNPQYIDVASAMMGRTFSTASSSSYRGTTPSGNASPQLAGGLLSPLAANQKSTPYDQNFQDLSPQQLKDEAYFVGKYGQHVNAGAFQLVALIGRGAYSTVWLGIDRKCVTSRTSTNLLLRYRHGNKGYNASSAVANAQRVPAYVVLKISKNRQSFVGACEDEYSLNQKLAKELQKRRLPNKSLMSLYALSFLEVVPPPGSSGEQDKKKASPSKKKNQPPTPETTKPSMVLPDLVNHHFVMVADVCGPSLLNVIVEAGPRACTTAADQYWRLKFIRKIVKQLLQGLEALHTCRIAHTDIKPENILLALPSAEVLRKMSAINTPADTLVAQHRTKIMCNRKSWRRLKRQNNVDLGHMDTSDVVQLAAEIKLADFGNSQADRKLRPTCLTAPSYDENGEEQEEGAPYCGPHFIHQTREYRSPEVILQLHPEHVASSGAMDVWSAACLAFELLTGDYLFNPRKFLIQQAVAAVQQQFQQQARSGSPLDQAIAQAAMNVNGDSIAGDCIHLQMVQELLQRPLPSSMIASCGATVKEGLKPAFDAATNIKKAQATAATQAAAQDGDGDSLKIVTGDEEEEDTSRTLLLALLGDVLIKPYTTSADNTPPSPDDAAQRARVKLEASVAQAADFIKEALIMNPTKRPTAGELLQHRWFKGVDDDDEEEDDSDDEAHHAKAGMYDSVDYDSAAILVGDGMVPFFAGDGKKDD